MKKTIIFAASLAVVAMSSVVHAQTASTTTTLPVTITTTSAPATSAHAVGSSIEVHINDNGKVLVRGAKIVSISGSSMTATVTWGSEIMTWVINTNGATEIVRRYGGATTVSQMNVGDYISFAGMLDTTQAQPTVNASLVKDWSIQKAYSNFSGTVSTVNAGNTSFVLSTHGHGNITVSVSSSTVVTKGNAPSTFAEITPGATISSTSGLYDNLQGTLAADKVKIYVNQALLNKRIFTGTLGTVTGTTAPTTLMLTVGSTQYTVNIATNTSLLSNSWNPATLAAMKAGDTIRMYGAVQTANQTTIDAYIVRDTSVK